MPLLAAFTAITFLSTIRLFAHIDIVMQILYFMANS